MCKPWALWPPSIGVHVVFVHIWEILCASWEIVQDWLRVGMLLILYNTIWLKIMMAVNLVVQVQRPGIGDSIALDMFLGNINT